MAIVLARKAAHRPIGVAQLNRAHPRAVGLAFAAPLSLDRRDLVSGSFATATGSEAFVGNAGGLYRSFGSGQYLDFTRPSAIGANTPFTIAWTQDPRSTSSYSAVLAAHFGTAGVNFGFAAYQSASDSAYYFMIGARRGSAAHVRSFATAMGAVTNGRLDRFVVTLPSGSQDGSTARLWRNGVEVSPNATISAFGSNTAAIFRIGALASGTDPFEGLLGDMRLWSRVLSDGEAAQESTLAGALELYAPRRIFVPVSASAPSSFIASWARRPARTIGAGVI